MRRCSRENCKIQAEFECFCNNERKVFCQRDNIRHINEVCAIHANTPLDLEDQNKIQKILIKTLSEKLEIVLYNKKTIFDLTSQLIIKFEECINEKVRQLSDLEKTLQKTINDVKHNMVEIDSSYLKNAFKMSTKNFKAECEKWDLIKITINTPNAEEIVDEWIKIESQIESLLTNTSIKAVKAFNEEEEKKTKGSPKSNDPKPIDKTFGRSLTSRNAPLLNNFNNLICKDKHELKWLVSAPYENYTQTKSVWINCQSCKANFSTSCWSCTACNYNICESCGISVGISSPKLRCGKHHELFWRPDASFYYEHKGNARGFKCKSCNAIKDEPHWHCQECNFDVCISCGKNKKQIPPSSTPKCLQNHILVQNSNSANPSEICMALSCCSCKKDINNCLFYACKTCLYFVCNKCYDFMNYSVAALPILFCQSYHPPHWVKSSNFECNYCFSILNQEHYSCSSCNYHICFECSNKLFNYAIKCVTLLHGPKNHPLEWFNNTIERNKGKPIKCVNCKSAFLRAGMFYCSTCNCNICMLCANDPDQKISRGQRPKSSQFDNQFILKQNQLAGEKLLKKKD